MIVWAVRNFFPDRYDCLGTSTNKQRPSGMSSLERTFVQVAISSNKGADLASAAEPDKQPPLALCSRPFNNLNGRFRVSLSQSNNAER